MSQQPNIESELEELLSDPPTGIFAGIDFKDLIYVDNPFFKLISQDNSFAGNYIPVPIEYGKSDDEQS